MDAQDDGGQAVENGDGEIKPMSPESSKAKLQLPMSVDPPGPSNPPKQLVWIVGSLHLHDGDAKLRRPVFELCEAFLYFAFAINMDIGKAAQQSMASTS
jgi:hypothetical protein